MAIPFAVAEIKYKILGTPFFEENIQNKNIQDFTLQYKHQSTLYPNYTKFTQPTITNNNQLKSLNPSSTSQQSNTSRKILQNTHFQIPNLPSTNIKTNHYLNATYTQPVINPSNKSPNVSNIPIYNTNPPSTKPQPTVSQPTSIISSTSISEPIKPYDGLDQNYTPEDNLQHIEARVTFSLGLQPTSDYEY